MNKILYSKLLGMSLTTISQQLQSILGGSPPEGHTSVVPFSTVFCSAQHSIKSVTIPQPTALLVLQGTKVLTLQSETVELHSGDMFMLPPQVSFSVENIPDDLTDRYMALCLNYEEQMLARVAALDVEAQNASPYDIASFRFTMSVALENAIGTLLDSIERYPHNTHLYSLYHEAVLSIIAEHTTCLSNLWKRTQSWQARCAFLFSVDPGYKWTVTEVAARLGVGERSLRRHLQAEHTGFRELLQTTRLNAALSRLQLGKENVGEIAYLCGYESASRFAGLFKKQFGISPSELLRANAVSEYSLTE